LLVIHFLDSLYGGINTKGTGTAIIEVKLAQQLAFLDQMPGHQIFLDLHKAYDAMDCKKTLDILAGYSIGPKVFALSNAFGLTQSWYVAPEDVMGTHSLPIAE
jgi:hypothetical protein